MKNFSILVLSGIFASGAMAASPMPEAQKQSSPKSQAAAEDRHNAKTHGTNASANQPEVQMQGNSKAQSAAEGKHQARSHGVNATKSIPLENGSTVFVFQDGKMGMEDKMGRATRMKQGQVMKAKDGSSLAMVGNEVMRVESLSRETKGGAN